MVDMFEEQARIVHAKVNLELLCDMLSVVSKVDWLEQWKVWNDKVTMFILTLFTSLSEVHHPRFIKVI